MDNFEEIFNRLKQVMEKLTPPFTAANSTKTKYELYSKRKDMDVMGKKVNELYFSSIIIQKNFVGFYYFPLYVKPEIKNSLKPELLKLLKGKTCFHIMKPDGLIIEEIEKLLKSGLDYYKKMNWI